MKNKHPLARRLVADDTAVPTREQHRKPCADCPWARASLPGWLGSHTTEEWLQFAHSETYINCHCTTNQACAGAAIYRANVIKTLKDPTALTLPVDKVTVFASPMEFWNHHSQERCETCGSKLMLGHLPGNHVRGDEDERCDKCFTNYVADAETALERKQRIAEEKADHDYDCSKSE